MRNLDFKYIRAKNFICFGPDGIEIDLQSSDSIIHVTGRNLDHQDEDNKKKYGSNAVGKSTIPEIITYALFGKTLKNQKKVTLDQTIHKSGKGLEVEVYWSNFRVLRRRKPNSLQLWEEIDGNWEEITKGKGTQKLIEDKLGLAYETFVKLVVFTDNDVDSFLEADLAHKRELIENLLSLEIYRKYAETVKQLKKTLQADIDGMCSDYESAINEMEASKQRMEKAQNQEQNWVKEQNLELSTIKEQIISLKKKLSASDEGSALAEYHAAQEKIALLNESTPKLNESLTQLEKMIQQGDEKYSISQKSLDESIAESKKLQYALFDVNQNIETLRKSKLKFTFEESQCPTCLGEVDSKNFQHVLDETDSQIKDLESNASDLDSKIKDVNSSRDNKIIIANKIKEKIENARQKRVKLSGRISEIQAEIHQLQKVEKPNAGSDNLLLEEKINTLKEQGLKTAQKIKAPSPFAQIIKDATQEYKKRVKVKDGFKKEVKKAEEMMKYYDYYKIAFGDDGIRKKIIDGINPALNARIQYWMHILMNNINLKFDSHLNETIERNPADGYEYVYHLLSRSQKRRVNLAISQAFAYVMELNTGCSPNILFLDEVSSSVDSIGIPAIYDMICELSKDKIVFVTTHERDLQEMLDGRTELRLEMKDGVSKVI